MLLALAFALAAFPAAQEARDVDAAAVEREVSLRRIAFDLTRWAADGPVEIEVVRELVDELLPGNEVWTRRFAVLDACARAGLLVVGEGVLPDGDERPELLAARIRVTAVGANATRFVGVMRGVLESPYLAVRGAALDRIARALIDGEVPWTAWSGIAVDCERIDAETLGELARIVARSGATSRVGADLALRLQMQADDASAGSAVSALMEEWITRPTAAPAVEFLREACMAAAAGERARVEALALVAVARDGVSLDVPPRIEAVAGLFRVSPGGTANGFELEERLERIARQAHSAALGRVLVEHAADREDAASQRISCIRGAAWSLSLDELLTSTHGLSEDVTLEMWDVVASRNEALPVEATRPWIEDERADVRAEVARAVGRRYLMGREPGLAVLVGQMLTDDDSTQRSLAFAWLCGGPHVEPFGGALRAAYDAEAQEGSDVSPRQARWLAQLPRNVPVPAFRDLVIRLVEQSATRSPSIIELLGTYTAGDEGVAEVLDRALAEELAALVRGGTFTDRLVPDSRAAALVRALHRTRGAAAVPLITDALERSMGPMNGGPPRENVRPQLPKTAVSLLAATEAGRYQLRRFLVFDDVVPRRVRFEVALQLARTASSWPELASRVGAHIVTDFGVVDGTLRMRGIAALAALAPVEDTVVDTLLGELARGTRGDEAERLAAIAALGRRGALELLVAVVEIPLTRDEFGLADLEAASAAARGLADPVFDGRLTAPTEAILELLQVVDGRVDAWDGEEIEREAFVEIRGALITSLCAGIARRESAGLLLDSNAWLDFSVKDAVRSWIVRRPETAGADDIAARFAGEDLGDVRFRWQSELAAVDAWGQAAAFFTPNSGLGHAPVPVVDSRLLLVLGEGATRQGHGWTAPEWLLSTGLFAVEGEQRTRDAARDLALGRAALTRFHMAAEQWDAAALQALRLLVEVRRDRTRRSALESLFDVSDPSIPSDAEARLAGLVHVFRGRAALDRADRKNDDALDDAPNEARRRAAAARMWARLDVAAAEALAELDAKIAASAR